MHSLMGRAGALCWKRPSVAVKGTRGTRSALGTLLAAIVRLRPSSRVQPGRRPGLVHGFFEHLIESRTLGAVNQAKGRFRSFLLASFQNFAAIERHRADAEKRGGRVQVNPIDWQNAEGRIALEPKDPLTPKRSTTHAGHSSCLARRAWKSLAQVDRGPAK
jgi:hypothetical protein